VTDAVAALADRIVCRFESPAATVFRMQAGHLLDDWPAYWQVLDAGERGPPTVSSWTR